MFRDLIPYKCFGRNDPRECRYIHLVILCSFSSKIQNQPFKYNDKCTICAIKCEDAHGHMIKASDFSVKAESYAMYKHG